MNASRLFAVFAEDSGGVDVCESEGENRAAQWGGRRRLTSGPLDGFKGTRRENLEAFAEKGFREGLGGAAEITRCLAEGADGQIMGVHALDEIEGEAAAASEQFRKKFQGDWSPLVSKGVAESLRCAGG